MLASCVGLHIIDKLHFYLFSFAFVYWSSESGTCSVIDNIDIPRYTMHVIDMKNHKLSNKFGVFIVPRGREREWLFSTEEGSIIVIIHFQLILFLSTSIKVAAFSSSNPFVHLIQWFISIIFQTNFSLSNFFAKTIWSLSCSCKTIISTVPTLQAMKKRYIISGKPIWTNVCRCKFTNCAIIVWHGLL